MRASLLRRAISEALGESPAVVSVMAPRAGGTIVVKVRGREVKVLVDGRETDREVEAKLLAAIRDA